jgi:hypothetical protein
MQKESTKFLPKKQILLDSNAYFRLADNLYPLLSEPFGKSIKYELKILGGTLREYNFQARLQSKFTWVDSDRHREDRKRNKLRVKKEVQLTIKDSKEFILSESASRGFTCSPFDIECLATALELSILLVTDDEDLYNLSQEYEIQCISTLELLKLMYDEERLSLKEIQDTVYMWDYMKDLPRNFTTDFKSIFGIEPERY